MDWENVDRTQPSDPRRSHQLKESFGDNWRFICCDQFPASRTDLAPLRRFITSNNPPQRTARSRPQGTNNRDNEWNVHRAQVVRTNYNGSLATTIELSLTPRTCCPGFGPNARGLSRVVAFPQGIDEKNLKWLFPTISNRKFFFFL